MKFVFKIMIILLITLNNSHSREVVTLNINPGTSDESISRIKNALIEHLGIPKKFITIKKVNKKECSLIHNASVIGICIDDNKFDVFYVNKKTYENTIKKIIELHRSSKKEVKNV